MYDRSKTIGASDAVHIQAGQWAELFDRKTSSDAPESILPARIGKALESFNLQLFSEETGIDARLWHSSDDPVTMGDYGGDRVEWLKYLPDSIVHINDNRIPVELKAINMMWRPELLLKKYMPQLQHAMRVMQAPYCYFSVIYLNTRYELTQVPYDPPYADALLEKEELFYWFLKTGKRPPQKKGRKWI